MRKAMTRSGVRLTAGCVVLGALALDSATTAAQCVDWGHPDPYPVIGTFDLLPDAAADLTSAGDIGWLARSEYGALVSVDLSDPGHPVVLGAEPVAIMDETYEVAVSGDRAFVTYLQWGGQAGVRLFDISDPADPVDVGNFQAPGNTWALGLAARENLLFVCFPYALFGVLDVSDPSAPVLVGQLPVDHPRLVALAGDLAYVTTDDQPRIIDVSDPTSPTLVAALPTSAEGIEVTVVGPFAYVATAAGLEIFDVADPSTPLPVGSAATPAAAISVDVSGDVAYVFVRLAGVHVYDLRDPTTPSLIGVIAMPTSQWAEVHEIGDVVMVVESPLIHLAPRQCPLAPAAADPLPVASGLRLQAAPNPFNPQTTITFDLPAPAATSLEIFDLAGRRVRTLIAGESLAAGPQARTWRGLDTAGREAPSGTYVCRLRAGDTERVTRIALLR